MKNCYRPAHKHEMHNSVHSLFFFALQIGSALAISETFKRKRKYNVTFTVCLEFQNFLLMNASILHCSDEFQNSTLMQLHTLVPLALFPHHFGGGKQSDNKASGDT